MNEARPITTRGISTRARIVEAAAALVFAQGVAGTSLDDVRAASGTSKSQLYHYFADKDALIGAVIQAQATRVIEFQSFHLDQATSLAGLRRWRDAVVEISQASGGCGGCPLGSLASALADRSEEARALLADGFRAWEARLTAGLAAMHERGELEPGAQPADLATAIMSALQGGLLLAQTMRSTRPLALALDMALDHVARHAA